MLFFSERAGAVLGAELQKGAALGVLGSGECVYGPVERFKGLAGPEGKAASGLAQVGKGRRRSAGGQSPTLK